MHRKTTSRRENKRLDQKHRRAAVKQALRGDHQASPPSWHSISWDRNEIPLDMEPRPASKKRHAKKIDWCPARKGEGNKRHFYIEKVERIVYPRWFDNARTYEYDRQYKVCMYCGKEGRRSRKGGRHYY